MDLLGSLGAAEPRRQAKDANAPERPAASDGSDARKAFDGAVDTAASAAREEDPAEVAAVVDLKVNSKPDAASPFLPESVEELTDEIIFDEPRADPPGDTAPIVEVAAAPILVPSPSAPTLSEEPALEGAETKRDADLTLKDARAGGAPAGDPRPRIAAAEILNETIKAAATTTNDNTPRALSVDGLNSMVGASDRWTPAADTHIQAAALRSDAPAQSAAAADAARQVIAAIKADKGGANIDVRLDPPDLGRVRIHFAIDRTDAVVATMTADRSDTLDAMRRYASDLVRELERAGFTNVHLDFASSGMNANDGDPPKASARADVASDDAHEATTFLYAKARPESLLDRLV